VVLILCITRFDIYIFYIMPTEQYLYGLYIFQNKQQSFPYPALTDWFYEWECMCFLHSVNCIFKYYSWSLKHWRTSRFQPSFTLSWSHHLNKLYVT
jgi:uncharacterized protein Usg